MNRAPLSVWHSADPAKGRRLLAGDLANDNRVAARLAWHFEPDASGRPHLVTAAAVRGGVDAAVEAEYLVALWLLVCVAAAIDPTDDPARARRPGARQRDRRRPRRLEAARVPTRPEGRRVRR